MSGDPDLEILGRRVYGEGVVVHANDCKTFCHFIAASEVTMPWRLGG
jgi:hypothetical protein